MFKDKLQKQYAAIVAVVAILFSWLVFAFGAQAQTTEPETKLEIIPANPKTYQPVILRVTPATYLNWPRVRMNANRISVTVDIIILPATHPPRPPLEVNLGQLPPGNYEVEVLVKSSNLYDPASIGVKSFVVTGAAKEVYGWEPLNAFSDLWWNPAEPGWGMNVTVKNGVLFAAWFVYDDAGRAAWLTIQGVERVDTRCYRGKVLRTTGSAWGGILGLSGIKYDEVGTGKFCFNNDNSAVQFTYTVDNISNQKTLYRQMGNVFSTANELTALFSFYSNAAYNYFYTTSPQMGAAAVNGTLLPNNGVTVYTPVGTAANNYPPFPGTNSPVRAQAWIFTSNKNPQNPDVALRPLYRLSYKCGDPLWYVNPVCGPNPKHVDHFYSTDINEVNQYAPGAGYKLDGIEGYVYPYGQPQPPGAEVLVRAYHAGRDDHAIFPLSENESMSAQGYNQYVSYLGYVYPNYTGSPPTYFGAQPQTLEVVPANPKAYQPVTLRFTPANWYQVGPYSVQMNANRLTITIITTDGPVILPGTPPLLQPIEADIGQLPAGNYEVEVILKNKSSTTSLGVKPFVVADASLSSNYWAPLLRAFSDLWWNPAESGWGMNITVNDGTFFATWFAYDAAGRAAWLTIQNVSNTWSIDWQPRCYQGQVLRTSGPPLGGILGLNSKVDYSDVGSGKLCFSEDNQSVQFTYTVDGVSNQKTLYRQPF